MLIRAWVLKEYYIQYAVEIPKIDGNLDDPIWSKIIPITDFIQEEPNNMSEPTEKTEVYLAYDSKYLYIAARLYDSNPSEIVQQLAPYDDWYGAFDEMADWFSIDFDSRHDHQTGYSFAVNASGVSQMKWFIIMKILIVIGITICTLILVSE